MASKQTTPSSLIKNNKIRRKNQHMQTILWLVVALIVGGLTFLLWMAKDSFAAQASTVASPDIQMTMTSAKFEAPAEIAPLHELDKEVEPINFEPLVRDMRQHPDEFKDKKFLKSNAGKWTVQIMDVSEYEIITDYLNGREDRNKFAYFRYRNENDQPRYILMYDTFPSAQMAMGASKLTDFNLPANIGVIPEEVNRYLSVVDNYELSEPVRDLKLNKDRKVKLQPTHRVIPVRVPPPKEPSNTTKQESAPQQPVSDTSNNKKSADKVNTTESSKTQKEPVYDSEHLTINEDRSVVAGTSKDKKVVEDKSTQATPPKKPIVKKEEKPAKSPVTTKEEKPAKNNTEVDKKDKQDEIKTLIEEKSN